MVKKIRVAIIGTGNIGTDLVERLLPDPRFEVVAFVGRRAQSTGLIRMSGRVPFVLDGGIESLEDHWSQIDGIFDATSADGHRENWVHIQGNKKWAIDLTPSRIGIPYVPVLSGRVKSINLQSKDDANYSMVTCGGQSSAPIVHGISKFANKISEVEVSSSIASLSAGPATRENLDEYIDATENMCSILTDCSHVKSILVLNPATPPVMMRTTVHIRAEEFELSKIKTYCKELVQQVKQYVPGYALVVEPHLTNSGQVSATVKVEGAGFFLPEYAGNLDIINAAAVETAAQHELSRELIKGEQ
jgi:acetaldehyde dehydrogenase (acetylating)